MTGGAFPEPSSKTDFFAAFASHVTPDSIAVQAQVERIRNSDPFIRSTNAQKLIEYLVTAMLRGEQDRLKESIIGIEVFGRLVDFDPKTDSIVRVEMRRIRSKLSEYYLKEGSDDDVLIWLEKGSYVPLLKLRREKQPLDALAAVSAVKDGTDAPPSVPSTSLPALPPGAENSALAMDTEAPVPQKFQKRFRLSSGLLVAFGVLIAGVIWFRFVRFPSPQRTPSPRLFPLTGNAGTEMSPAFSPDGKQIAFSWDGNRRNLDIYIKQLDGSAAHRLTDHAAHDIHPAWSPDGQRLAFLRIFSEKSQLIILPAGGGVETIVREAIPPEIRWHPDQPESGGSIGPAWSPDGTYLVTGSNFNSAQGLGLKRTTFSGQQTALTHPSSGAVDDTPSFSPSGRHLAFVRKWSSVSGDIFILPSSGGSPTRLTSEGGFIQGMAWLDDEQLIYSSNREGSFRLWQISRRGGEPQVVVAGGARPQWPSVSPDHRWLAFVDTKDDTNIWQFSLSNRGTAAQAEPFISSAGADYSPAYSPDGKRIVFVSDRSGKQQLWLADYDGTEVHQLTNFEGSGVGSPRWSPDGRRIVFDASLLGKQAIWLMNSDGSEIHSLNISSAKEYVPSWSRDGAWVYFVSNRLGHEELWKERPDSGEAVPVAPQIFFDVVESSIGDYAFAQQPGGGIWQIPLQGGKPIPVPELKGVTPVRYWTVQGDKLYFVRQEHSPRDLEELDLQTRQVRKLMQIPGVLLAGTPGLTVDPAAHTLLFVQMSRSTSHILLQGR